MKNDQIIYIYTYLIWGSSGHSLIDSYLNIIKIYIYIFDLRLIRSLLNWFLVEQWSNVIYTYFDLRLIRSFFNWFLIEKWSNIIYTYLIWGSSGHSWIDSQFNNDQILYIHIWSDSSVHSSINPWLKHDQILHIHIWSEAHQVIL